MVIGVENGLNLSQKICYNKKFKSNSETTHGL